MFFKKIKRIIQKLNSKFVKLNNNKVRQPYSEFIRLFNSYNNPDGVETVLFLGDSVAERVSWEDNDQQTLSQILEFELRNKIRLIAISYGGFTLKVFYYFLLALEKMSYKPKAVVLPINMRNFSPQWDLEPKWSFQQEINLVENFIVDASISPSLEQVQNEDIPIEVFNAFDACVVDYPLSPLNRVGHFRLLINAKAATDEQNRFRLSQIFIFHYAYVLDFNHRKMIFLKSILDLLRKMRIPAFVYITPMNIDAGVRLVGDAFSDIVRSNVGVVSNLVNEYCTGDGIIFYDWSEKLPSKYFFHPDNATEHLNESGRHILASCISREIHNLLSGK